jgi:hypothetical protein
MSTSGGKGFSNGHSVLSMSSFWIRPSLSDDGGNMMVNGECVLDCLYKSWFQHGIDFHVFT